MKGRSRVRRLQPAAVASPDALIGALERTYKAAVSKSQEFHHHPKPTSLHDLRVAVRRLNAAIDLALAVEDSPPLRKARKGLRRTIRRLNQARDVEITIPLLASLVRRYPLLRPLLQTLRGQLRASASADDTLTGGVAGGPLDRVLADAISEMKAANQSGEEYAAIIRAIEGARASAYLRVARAIHRVEKGDDTSFHRVRTALKRYRYVVEALAPVAPAGSDSSLRIIRAMQRALGDLQDWAVLQRTLLRYLKRQAIPSQPSSLALLSAVHARHDVLVGRALDAVRWFGSL